MCDGAGENGARYPHSVPDSERNVEPGVFDLILHGKGRAESMEGRYKKRRGIAGCSVYE